MSMTATSRRGSVTCIFEDLERKAQVNVNTDKPDMTALSTSTPTKIIGGKNPPGIIPVHGGQLQDESSHSSAVSTVSIDEMCKICHCGGESGNNVSLIAPCYCSGSLKYVHQECLQRWIKSSDIKRCELCKYPFAMQAKVSELKIIVYDVLDFRYNCYYKLFLIFIMGAMHFFHQLTIDLPYHRVHFLKETS